jgi:protein-S-isoprenylcysteine O-methyltransferase Ste14
VYAVTPLTFDYWAWFALCAVWLVAALFARPTKSSENVLGRLQHIVPMYAGFFLIFYHRDFGILDYRLYGNNAIAWLGTVLTFTGVAFSIWARVTLGRYWSGIITLKQGHRLITAGPYRLVRHPIYTGFIVGSFGSALTAARVDAGAGFAIIAISLVFKLRREEALMTREFGDEYLRFKQEVPALFPRISLGSGAEQSIRSDDK